MTTRSNLKFNVELVKSLPSTYYVLCRWFSNAKPLLDNLVSNHVDTKLYGVTGKQSRHQ